MSLRARLAMQGTRPSSATARVEPVEPRGFERVITSHPCRDPLSRDGSWPVGFERLRVPSVDGVRDGLRQVQPGLPWASPPALALDLETTGGLGRGGAVPFLAAVAWHETAETIAVAQWTLRGPEGERDMLLDLARFLEQVGGSTSAILTYNGSAFDLPVLRHRLQRLAITPGALARPHVDLLPAARRLWKGVWQDCRLTTLEARVLGVERIGDLAGEEVAEVFPQWVARPHDPWVQGQLAAAQRHNRADVAGLLALAAAAGERLEAPEDASQRLRAAGHFARLGRLDEARDRLADLLGRGPKAELGGGEIPRALLREALVLAARLERKANDLEAAAGHWRRVCDLFPGDVEAHERLAIHLEHVARAPAEALAVARASDCPCPRRLARLERKTARGSAARGPEPRRPTPRDPLPGPTVR